MFSSVIKHIGLLLCFFSLSLSAQDKYEDSLRLVIKTTKQDTALTQAMNALGEYIYHVNPDTALIIWKQVIKITSENLKKPQDKESKYMFSSDLARAYLSFGIYSQSRSGHDAALNYFNKSLAINTAIDNKEGIANCLVDMGRVYYRKGNVLRALENYHKGLKIYEKIDAPISMAYCLGSIGILYAAQDEFENGLNYLNRSAAIYKKYNHNDGLGFALSGIAGMYMDKGDPKCKGPAEDCLKKGREKALAIYFKVLELSRKEEKESKTGIAKTCRNISSVYLRDGNLPKAFDYASQALVLYNEVQNKQGIGTTANMLANIAFDQGNLKLAETYADKGMAMGKILGTPHLLQSASTILKKIYEKQNNYKGALEMQELSVKMRDSINNETIRNKSIKKQFEMENEKRSERDSILNTIKIAAEQFRHEQAIGKQRLYTFGGIIGFVLALIVAIISYRAYKTKQKANTIITQQKTKIEIANKNLQRQHLLNQKIFSVISHDFRGPILSLNLVLNRFKDNSTNEKLNSYLQDIGTSVYNASAVLNNLLNWAKTEIEMESFDKSDCKVQAVVEKTEKEFAEKLSEKKLELVHYVPDNAMMGLPHDILQIALRNLLSNAIKFSNREGKIEIVFNENGTLIVKDSGMGISPEKQARLFNGQVNAATGTNKEEGFGIGLYIVSELLYKYGYSITVESKLGEGASFKIAPLK